MNTEISSYGMVVDESNKAFLCQPNMKLKMSKKVLPDSYPTTVKKLLSTGILEGARVKYVTTSQEILSAYEFELHAGGKSRHPNNHIYLENGKPIYSVIQELKTAPHSVLNEVVKNVASSSVNEESFQACKESLQENSHMVKTEKRGHISVPGMHHATTSGQMIEDSLCPTLSSYVQNYDFKQQNCMKEVLEGKKKGVSKKDNDLHRLLFMPNGLLDGAELAYYSKGQRILGGYKQGNGIVCSCCHTEISPSHFKAHAGWSARRQPYRNIYTSGGLTLHDIALSLANGQNLATGSSDDMCAACGAGGDLIICDGCPRAFHTVTQYSFSHLVQELPRDKWFCCDDCNRIHVALQNLVLVGAEMIPASVSYAIHRKHVEKGFTDGVSNGVQWRILSGKSRYQKHLPILSRAASIFRECFDLIVATSGRDLIPVMVYGRNIFGQEFGGMYCVVLIVKSVVVSTGLLRIFGREVAELPLVATSKENQGKGYFQALFSCIEILLYSLNVENLVLPAAEEAESIWTKKLGLRKISDERLFKYTRNLQLTIFKGTSMLEKKVQQIAD
ncbi:hypothetical protein ACSBR2_003085 [Camellia fascicularis]